MRSNQDSDLFDAYYYEHSCGRPYRRDDHWLNFFDAIAERIVGDLQPRTVMDVGCAMGFLVEALRKRGVDAFGIDISKYAIAQVIPEIKPYCWVASILDPLPQDYDLISSIEVLEHLQAAEAQKAVKEICKHTKKVLFSSTPFDHKEVTHKNVQPTDYWAELFARHGFYRDVDYDASFITPWAILFEKREGNALRIVRSYERKYWQLWKANIDLRESSHESQIRLAKSGEEIKFLQQQIAELSQEFNGLLQEFNELSQEFNVVRKQYEKELKDKEGVIEDLQLRLGEKAEEIQKLEDEVEIRERDIHAWKEQAAAEIKRSYDLQGQVKTWEERWNDLERGAGWKLLHGLRLLRMKFIPRKSRRERSYYRLLEMVGVRRRDIRLPDRDEVGVGRRSHSVDDATDVENETSRSPRGRFYAIEEIVDLAPHRLHEGVVDIVVCVHNALDDVKRCLKSVVERTMPPFHLILVDDGSDLATERFLRDFSIYEGATLARNDEASGYTRAANQGIRLSTEDHIVLLNSDTIVTDEWLDRMIACADSDPGIGIVGPLSNSASWQSIPEVLVGDDWAQNPSPRGVEITEIGKIVSKNSAKLYPRMPLLNGFCLLIKREMLADIGDFDEEWFGDGYGEENDFALRARDRGWRLALADDAYVYHAQSKSYSHKTRIALAQAADLRLIEKHGPQVVQESVSYCRENRVLNGIRARSRVMYQRQNCIERGKEEFTGKRLLFLLPIAEPGGGGNVVIDEARAMREMGVEVELFNLQTNMPSFLDGYPRLDLPVRFGVVEGLSDICSGFDAVCATVNFTVDWLASLPFSDEKPILGYYIQDFEPFIYQPDTPGYRKALESYTRIPDVVRFTKTQWNREVVLDKVGVDSRVVGPSVNIDLFRPRPTGIPIWPDRPLRVAAMIRPSTLYRQPRLTLEVLKSVIEDSGSEIEIILFGVDPDDPAFLELPLDFPWKTAGMINQYQVARLMNKTDIFTDFSYHQAMGLTAMEAMACGAAVIVPEFGGAASFVLHGENGWVVNTNSFESCKDGLIRLIEDHQLRSRIQDEAMQTICSFYPEKAAYEILSALFNNAGE